MCLGEGLPKVHADLDQFKRVLLNIVNAMEGRDGGELHSSSLLLHSAAAFALERARGLSLSCVLEVQQTRRSFARPAKEAAESGDRVGSGLRRVGRRLLVRIHRCGVKGRGDGRVI